MGTREPHSCALSVREFVELAFAEVSRTIVWHGSDVEEVGVDDKSGEVLVEVDPSYFRPTDIDFLLGDASKVRRQLGWRSKVTFCELVEEMIAADLTVMAAEHT